jgi:hypothetical protein
LNSLALFKLEINSNWFYKNGLKFWHKQISNYGFSFIKLTSFLSIFLKFEFRFSSLISALKFSTFWKMAERSEAKSVSVKFIFWREASLHAFSVASLNFRVNLNFAKKSWAKRSFVSRFKIWDFSTRRFSSLYAFSFAFENIELNPCGLNDQ